MGARDDYQSPRDHRIGFQQYFAMCDEIDRLREIVADLTGAYVDYAAWREDNPSATS